MARTSVATDDFSGTLATNWEQLNSSWGSMVIIANQIESHTVTRAVGEGQAIRRNSGTYSNDQYSSLKLKEYGFWTASYNLGVICRASADTDGNRDFYWLVVSANASSSPYLTSLGKVVNGAVTTLHSADVAWAVDDLVELECEGTTIRAMKNGTALGGSFTQTDSALSSGRPGITGAGQIMAGDDWEGGDISAAGSTYRRRQVGYV